MSKMAHTFVHRCDVLVLDRSDGDEDGVPSYNYVTKCQPTSTTANGHIRCRLDLGLLRPGKDTGWTPEAGRPADRTGVLFTSPKVDIKPGDRIYMLSGPSGTFEVQGPVDEVWDFGALDHLEVFVMEVAQVVVQQ